jgi:hypothetical protein
MNALRPGAHAGIRISWYSSAQQLLLWGIIVLVVCSHIISIGQETKSQIPFNMTYSPAPKRQAQAPTAINWQTLETRYTVIRYRDLKDLKRFVGKIDYSPSQSGLKGLLGFSGDVGDASAMRQRIDNLFRRVQSILDMHQTKEKAIINVYADKGGLQRAYSDLVGGTCRVRAWYYFDNRTIYVNASDVHEGILAHEMAHHIIDHYFDVRPPRATAEILARYVDKHLLY